MSETTHRLVGLPGPQGLYDPRFEHDACGIGFVAHVRGERSNEIVRLGVELLERMTHRGAVGCDPCTGDGAGILLQLPHVFLRQACDEAGIDLPAPGAYGVAMLFLPAEEADAQACGAVVERIVRQAGLRVVGWREVPVCPDEIGPDARATAPRVRQLFVAGRRGDLGHALERRLYVARRRIERAIAESEIAGREAFYVCSFSSRTIVYKGLLIPHQLPHFYPDLADERLRSALALVHSRFSTNTFPTWARAHPFRMICHNGEINTLKGNLNWMRVREPDLASPLFGDDEVEALLPVIPAGQSDSASLDNALELLVMGGRSLPHALMMLMPEAWESGDEMDASVRACFDFHAGIMEPWDGPAAVAATDGVRVGAALDRNGLRPARWAVTHDDVFVLASEAGVLDFAPEHIRAKGRLGPGKMLIVDTESGRIREDAELKREVAARQSYGALIEAGRFHLADLPPPAVAAAPPRAALSLMQRQAVFGYTQEELRVILAPMGASGAEPVGSMGNDTPLAVLSERPQPLFKYFKQLFAQVTNPPIDPIRESRVMSLAMELGPRANLLDETPEHARRIHLQRPVLTADEMARLRGLAGSLGFRTHVLDAVFPVADGAAGLEPALERLFGEAERAVHRGANLLVVSDRAATQERAAIPSLLAVAGLHHHLIRAGLRGRVGLVAETAEAREVAHFALLFGYGAEAVHPYLAYESVAELARQAELAEVQDAERAVANYVLAVEKGLLKILSKMGISTLRSYCGAQLFEAVGLGGALVEHYFTGTASRIGGIDIATLGEETLRRHTAAFAPSPEPDRRLDVGGEYHYRVQGEHHHWGPMVIAKLQHATRGGRYETFQEFAALADDASRRLCTLRGLLDFREGTQAVPLEEVEPATEIVKRFATGAMSYGALSREAHETLAIAMNRLGGRSNSGEGGEDPARYRDERNSRIKQVASGRFGVTAEYLASAEQIQIKMAQGAKPGEGGQLPGHKVDEIIARTRHSTPGVTLISPPPHHDIYSIEDLAQLISDLKTINPEAEISVKLVAEAGVGTIAAGVAKAHADHIVIAGDSGGTGASPLSSIKHAGVPWELGLAETQQTLVLNDLRGRVRLQTDGMMRTGRDVMVAALLGAEEYGFSTAPLIVQGCIMMRKCHLNTCPVGITTQDPVLRAKFTGQPEHVVNYFFFVAEQVRELMSRLGLRTLDEAIGRVDLLRQRDDLDTHWKAAGLDLGSMLHQPEAGPEVARRRIAIHEHELVGSLGRVLLQLTKPAIERRKRVGVRLPVGTEHRTIGAMISGRIARRYGRAGLPDGTVRIVCVGSAGQSFGAFLARGITLALEGEANDYVGKGLSGGRVIVRPPREAGFPTEGSIIVGNTVLYGATSGEAFFRGAAGERFAVRNSGARAVVEGVGDHGCEYMTGGVVVVLGRTGQNFAAGMSGGVAYVHDVDGRFEQRLNRELVLTEPLQEEEDLTMLRRLMQRHARYTGSTKAQQVLEQWDEVLPRFVKIIPTEYKRVLERRRAAEAQPAVPLRRGGVVTYG
jgi:glutamate synthase (NADPH) large chain